MRAAAIILLALSLGAAEIIDIGTLTETEGIGIRGCHPGDQAMVEVVPENPGPSRVGGMFLTTNALLTMKEPAMTMVPTGTNLARIRTICQGSTSEVREVRFVIRRLLPAPRVERRSLVATNPPTLPLPPGMTETLPLPGGTNFGSYRDFLERLASGRRRSQ